MKTNIVSIGNSQGVRIPKILLEQSKLSGEVELEVRGESIVISPARKPREGWEEIFRTAADKDDSPDLADWRNSNLTDFDEEEWEW